MTSNLLKVSLLALSFMIMHVPLSINAQDQLPASTFKVILDDPDSWNDLTQTHSLTIEGEYESSIGQNGKVQYAVEDSGEWLDLTDEIEPGSSFTASMAAMFDANKENHTIQFRMMDTSGNISVFAPIIYKDVNYSQLSGIEDKTYSWGEPIYQTNLTCELSSDQFAIENYQNNLNAGTAYFDVEGVFPYSIGKKTYSYTINPLPLDGEVTFGEIHRTYTGYPQCPSWSFTNESFSALRAGTDYTVEWTDNVKPGTARLRVIGKGNFTNELTAEFQIDKAELPRYQYSLFLPDADITFDDTPHSASIRVYEGVGEAKLYYASAGTDEYTVEAPKEIGSYDIYLEIAEGEYYYGKPLEKVSSFTIYQFDETEWAIIERINSVFTQNGQPNFWNLSEGITAVSKLNGLKIEEGKVVEIDFSYNYLGVFPSELLAFSNLRSLNISGNGIYDAVENISYYVYDHPDAGFNLLELNISNNQFYGNLGEMASHFPNLRSLHAEGNCITDISPVISENVWDLNYSNQYIYEAIDFDMSNMYLSDLAWRLPQILFYDHYNRDYSRRVEFECSPCYGFTMQLWLENGYGGITFPEGQNVYTGENGTEFDVCDYSNNIQFRVRISFTDGDANFNNGLDITDLQAAILYAFGEYDPTQVFNFTGADTYRDYQINVQDIVATVNLLLNNSWMYGASGRAHGKQADMADVNTENAIWIEDGKIMLSTDTPIAAISIDLDGSADFDFSKFGMTTASKGGRTIAYSLDGGSIPAGVSELGTCTPNVHICGVALSDASARPVEMEITSGGATSIESIMNDKEGRYEICTPAGIRVSALQKGVNIVKSSDNKVSKIFVR